MEVLVRTCPNSPAAVAKAKGQIQGAGFTIRSEMDASSFLGDVSDGSQVTDADCHVFVATK